MRIALLRHGETDWNVRAVFQGTTDIPLNARGIEQAEDAGRLLRGRGWERIVASPLERAQHTARIIAEATGLPAPATHPGLIERAFGDFEGVSVYFDSGERRRVDDLDTVETRETVVARAIAAVEELASSDPRDLIIVTHGTLVRMLLSHYLGVEGPHIGNLAFSMLESTPQGFEVRVANGYPLR